MKHRLCLVSLFAGMTAILGSSGCSDDQVFYDDGESAWGGGDEGGSSSTGSPKPEHAAWAVGSWFAPAYVTPDVGQSPMGMGIYADGTYQHNTNGVIDFDGTWEVQGETLYIDGKAVAYRLPNCTAIRWANDSAPSADYYRDDYPELCPDEVAPLTAAEKCLVGEFEVVHQTNFDTGIFTTTRDEHRTVLFEQYWSDTQTSVIRQWKIQAGKLCELYVNLDTYECVPISWDDVRSTRQSSPISGCEYPDAAPPPPPPPPDDGCDTGTHGDYLSDLCDACVNCSANGLCQEAWEDFWNHPETDDLLSCYDACDCYGEAPCNTPDDCYQTSCDETYTGAAAARLAASICSVCDDCSDNCDADSVCY